jgi:anti-sigma factor RsiW
MICEEFKEYFDDYILGELDGADEIRLGEHLLECGSCRREVEERESLFEGFRKIPRSMPPESAYRKVRNAVLTTAGEKKPFYRHWIANTAYMAAAFLLGMVLMRGVDIASLRSREKPDREVGTRPSYRTPYADTIKFYSAPAKNLARI